MRLQDDSRRWQPVLGKYRAQLLVALEGDRCPQPFGIDQVAQRSRLAERVSLASDDDARVVEQLLDDQVGAGRIARRRADIAVDDAGAQRRLDVRK